MISIKLDVVSVENKLSKKESFVMVGTCTGDWIGPSKDVHSLILERSDT